MHSHTSTRLIRATLTAGLLTAVLALGACSSAGPDVVQGTGGASTGAGGSAASGATASVAGRPLTAADLPSWADAPMPEWAERSLILPCETPTGVRDHQIAVRSAALTAPSGISVLNQVADYGAAAAENAVTDTISRALFACPAYATDTHDVTIRSLPGVEGQTMAGAELVRTERESGLREVTLYWAAVEGAQTVEVSIVASLGAAGDPPLEQFARDVLAAARAKARGESVPVVSAPALPVALTFEQERLAREQREAEQAQTLNDGVPGDNGALLSHEEADRLATEAGPPVGSPPGFLDHGLEGNEGPAVIGGSIATDGLP